MHNAALELSIGIGGDRARRKPHLSMQQQTRERECGAADRLYDRNCEQTLRILEKLWRDALRRHTDIASAKQTC